MPNSAPCRIAWRQNIRHRRLACLFHILDKLSENQPLSVALTSGTKFGSACALCQGMMPQLTETLEHAARPQSSIEQARELLEALRAAYQSLPFAERSAVKSLIKQAQHKDLTREIDEERECFESLS